MYYPTFDEFCKKAEGGNLIPVYKEIFADLETPLSAFMKIDKGDYSFLLESVKKREFPEFPDLYFIITDTILIFDNLQHTIKVVYNAHIMDGDLKSLYENALKRIDEIVELLWGRLRRKKSRKGREKKLKWQSNVTQEGFIEKVKRAKEYIAAGDIFQVQVSQRFSLDVRSHPFDVYRALRRVNPSPYMFYLRFGDLHVVGSSPEVLVRLEGSLVETRPIAGTRRRGRDPEDDLRMERH